MSTEKSNPVQFSFVIPVYNTKDLLPACLDSIIAQTGYSIELILINDGSTDGSEMVCLDYQNRYDFIHTISKANEGQGVARNVGVSVAKGEIVCFVDSDDKISPDYCRNVCIEFEKSDPDFVNFGCDFSEQNENPVQRFLPQRDNVLEGPEIFYSALLIKDILSTPWSKAFKRRFLIENQVNFPPTRANEDIFFSCLAAYSAQKVGFINKVLYHATIRPGSTSRAMTIRSFTETEHMIRMARERFSDSLAHDVTARHFQAHIIRVFTYLLFYAAVRLRTKDEMHDAFACADRCGLRNFVEDPRTLSLLPLKNRIMALSTKRRYIFRPLVRTMHTMGLRLY